MDSHLSQYRGLFSLRLPISLFHHTEEQPCVIFGAHHLAVIYRIPYSLKYYHGNLFYKKIFLLKIRISHPYENL
jgi:hypothetical protein